MKKDTMDIVSLPIELQDNRLKSRYRLVTAAIIRAKQLQQGAMPLAITKAKKITTAAIEEVLTGSVTILTGDAAVKAQEEAGMPAHKTVQEEAPPKASLPNILTDLEREVEEYLRQKDKIDILRT